MESRNFIIYKIPLIKGICIVGVLIIHMTGGFTQMHDFGWLYYTLLFMNNFGRFAVPLFIAISGFYLSLNKRNELATPFYRRTLKFLIVPYLAYSLLYSAINLFAGVDLKRIILDIFLGRSAANMWFGLLILQLYLLHPLLRRAYLKCKHRGIFVLSAFGMQILWKIFSVTILQRYMPISASMLYGTSNSLTDIIPIYVNQFADILFLGYIGYFIAGYYLLENSETLFHVINILSARILGAIGWIVCAIVLAIYWSVPMTHGVSWDSIKFPYMLHYLITPILSLSMLITILSILKRSDTIQKIFHSFFYQFGLFSYGIYYIHIFIILIFTEIFTRLINVQPYDLFSFYGMQFLIVPIVSLLSVRILARLPYAKYIT